MRIKEIDNKEFREYVSAYVKRVRVACKNKLRFVSFSQALDGDTEHHIFEFELIGKGFTFTQKQIEVLTEDDDSQPHNQYRVYLGSLYIYSTRST